MTTSFDNDDKFSYTSSNFRFSKTNSFNMNSNEFDSEFDGNNSSITEVVMTKNDLKAKYSAALQTREMYEKRQKELRQKIDEINKSAGISLHLLEEKKINLLEENDRLRTVVESLPTVQFLQDQAKFLSTLLDVSNIPRNKSEILDAVKLQNIGVLQPDDGLAILQERLKAMVERLNTLMMITDNKNGKGYEAFQLRQKINIMQKSSPHSKNLQRDQCEQLEEEVYNLREEVKSLKEKQKLKNANPVITLEMLRNSVAEAGGDQTKLIHIRGNLYKYCSTMFNVDFRFGKIYASNRDIELPIVTFIRTLIGTPRSFRKATTPIK